MGVNTYNKITAGKAEGGGGGGWGGWEGCAWIGAILPPSFEGCHASNPRHTIKKRFPEWNQATSGDRVQSQ